MIRNLFAFLAACFIHLFTEAKRMFGFAVDRLSEPSTYGGLVAAIYAGASYAAPYSWIGIGVGCFFIVKRAFKPAATVAPIAAVVLVALLLAAPPPRLEAAPAPAAKADMQQRIDRALTVCRLAAIGSAQAKVAFAKLDATGQAETIFVCVGYFQALRDLQPPPGEKPSAAPEPKAAPGREI